MQGGQRIEQTRTQERLRRNRGHGRQMVRELLPKGIYRTHGWADEIQQSTHANHDVSMQEVNPGRRAFIAAPRKEELGEDQ